MLDQETRQKELDSYRNLISQIRQETSQLRIEPGKHNVVICAAPGNRSKFEYFAGLASPGAYLLYLLKEGEISEELKAAVVERPRTILCALGDPLCRERIQILLSMVPRRYTGFVADAELEAAEPETVDMVRTWVEHAQTEATQAELSTLTKLRAGIQNMPNMVRKAVTSPRMATPLSAVICSAGPSFNQQIPILRDYAGEVLVVALKRTLGALQENGITPDLVVDVDPSSTVKLPGVRNAEKVLLATTVASAPATAECFRHVLWVKGDSSAFNRLAATLGFELSDLRMGLSATVSALDLVHSLGCPHVALIGSDLCYGEGGKIHSNEDTKRFPANAIELPGNDSETVISDPCFRTIKLALEQAMVDAEGTEFWNCTLGGAQIGNCRRGDLQTFCRDHGVQTEVKLDWGPLNLSTPNLEPFVGLFDQLLDLQQQIVDSARLMEREIKNSRTNVEKYQAAHEQIGILGQKRTDLVLGSAYEDFFGEIRMQAEFLYRCGFLSEQDGDSTQANVERFHHAELITFELLRDFRTDLATVIQAFAEGSLLPPASTDDYRAFPAFASAVTRLARGTNPELATWLEKPCEPNPAFRIVANYIDIPTVDFGDTRVSACFESEESARRQVASFIESTGFDPQRNALVISAPGNWATVTAFLEYWPDMEILVAEPWGHLFHWLCHRTLLPFRLKRNVTIAVADGCLKKWQKVYRKGLQKLKRGKQLVMFVPEETSGISEVEEFIRSLPQ